MLSFDPSPTPIEDTFSLNKHGVPPIQRHARIHEKPFATSNSASASGLPKLLRSSQPVHEMHTLLKQLLIGSFAFRKSFKVRYNFID